LVEWCAVVDADVCACAAHDAAVAVAGEGGGSGSAPCGCAVHEAPGFMCEAIEVGALRVCALACVAS
jgi:hypothetical protein